MNKATSYHCSYVLNEKISIKKFIEEWSNLIGDELEWTKCKDLTEFNVTNLELPKNFIKSLEKNLKLDDSFVDKLIEESFVSPSRNFEDDNNDDNNDDLEIDTNQNPSETYHFADRMYWRRKYRLQWSPETVDLKDRHSLDCNHNNPLALLTVQIFKPAVKLPGEERIKLKLDREFQVLSCQALSVLRDSYFCLADIMDRSDYSDNPLEPLPKIEGHKKMGFYLIDQTIYYDDRCPMESLESIIKWSEEKIWDKCLKKTMCQSKFEDLKIKLGFPYLYMHRGNCEHLIVFSDIRLFIPEIEDDVEHYPKSMIVAKTNKSRCQMCNSFRSKWLTLHNKRLPMSPFYFCHNCFITFNYDDNLKKIGTFKAFPLFFNTSNTK